MHSPLTLARLKQKKMNWNLHLFNFFGKNSLKYIFKINKIKKIRIIYLIKVLYLAILSEKYVNHCKYISYKNAKTKSLIAHIHNSTNCVFNNVVYSHYNIFVLSTCNNLTIKINSFPFTQARQTHIP